MRIVSKTSLTKNPDAYLREIAEELEKTPEKNRVYIDESGVDKYLQREYRQATRGVPIFLGNRWEEIRKRKLYCS